MSKKFRRNYTEDERVAIVEEVLQYGSVALVATKYDIHPHQVSFWKNNYRRYQQTLPPKQPKVENVLVDYKKEYNKLLKTNREQELEIAILRDLLKKKKSMT